MPSVLYEEKTETQRHGENIYEDGDRDWSHVATNQRMPKSTDNHQDLGKIREVLPLEPSEGARPSSHQISDFYPPVL